MAHIENTVMEMENRQRVAQIAGVRSKGKLENEVKKKNKHFSELENKSMIIS